MRVPSTDDVTVELHDLGGDGPPLLIAHATGFCAGAYRPMAATLARTHHVWGMDFRGHGEATAPDDVDLGWVAMAHDVLAVVDALGGEPILAFGHSMGGACLARAELLRPGTLRAAFLFEPIIVPSAWALGPPGGNPMAAAARRRRSSFPSRAEALARYASRPPLGAFRADVLSAYVEHGFAEAADGSVALRCKPEHEAAVFDAPGKPQIDDLSAIDVPIVVAVGERDPGPGPASFAPAVAEALPRGELRRYAHVGHFGPFQDPDTLAEDVAATFAGR